MNAEVTCVGEAIVDLISLQGRTTLAEAGTFLKSAGGSAANIAAGLAKLGVPTAFAGLVGDDPFGTFLQRELRRGGVDVRGLHRDATHKTRLAFVALGTAGEREFEFWEARPADVQLRTGDLDRRRLSASRIVHLSSFLLLDEPARSTVIELAAELGTGPCWISFDPNLRLALWKSDRLARELHRKIIRRSTILRLNAEEAAFLTGGKDIRSAAVKLIAMGPSVVVITRGAAGCHIRTEEFAQDVAGYRVRSVDSTGCGDAFLAAFLFSLLRAGRVVPQAEDELLAACRFANAAGALTSMQYGVVAALPGRSDIERFLRKKGR